MGAGDDAPYLPEWDARVTLNGQSVTVQGLDRFARRGAPDTRWRDAPKRFRMSAYVALGTQVVALCLVLAWPAVAVGLFGIGWIVLGAPLLADMDGVAEWRSRYQRARGFRERGLTGSRLIGGWFAAMGAFFLAMAFGLLPR